MPRSTVFPKSMPYQKAARSPGPSRPRSLASFPFRPPWAFGNTGSTCAEAGQENIETVHEPKPIQAADTPCMDRVAVLWRISTAHKPGYVKGAVPASLMPLGLRNIRGSPEQMGAGFPAPTRAKATGTLAPLPPEGSADLLAPRPHRRRPAKRPATRERREASPLPGPILAPLPSMEPTLAVPPGWTGRCKRTPAPDVEAALERQLPHPSRPPACTTGHPDGPEPAGPERFPPGDFKRF